LRSTENYCAVETLGDGLEIEIRALRSDDHDDFITAVGETSPQSLYRRFFAAKPHFTDAEKSFFLNPDFVKHVALVAVLENCQKPTIVGGGRYVVTEPGKAEVAFMVVDKHQGHGIGAALLRNIVTIARNAELHELTAEVLATNRAMLNVFERSGLDYSVRTRSGVVHVVVQL
jgi:RimJ/RimL family protein N-acetyltransferase